MKWFPVGFHVPTESAIDKIRVTHHARCVTLRPPLVVVVLVKMFEIIYRPFIFDAGIITKSFFGYNVDITVSASQHLK